MRILLDRTWRPAREAGVPYRVFGRVGRVVYAGPLIVVFGRR